MTSRFESEPFGDLYSLGRKLRPLLSEARPEGCPLGPAKLYSARAARRVRRRRMLPKRELGCESKLEGHALHAD